MAVIATVTVVCGDVMRADPLNLTLRQQARGSSADCSDLLGAHIAHRTGEQTHSGQKGKKGISTENMKRCTGERSTLRRSTTQQLQTSAAVG